MSECVLNLKTQLPVVIENGPREVGKYFRCIFINSLNLQLTRICNIHGFDDLMKIHRNAYQLSGDRSRTTRSCVFRFNTHSDTYMDFHLSDLSRDTIT